MLLVRDLMTTELVTAPPYDSLTNVAACMRDADVGCVLLTDGDTLHGIITDRDITVRVTAEGMIAGSTPAHQVASANLVTVTPETTVCDAAALMCIHTLHRLPVVDDRQRLLGLLSLADIAATPHAQEVLVSLSRAQANR